MTTVLITGMAGFVGSHLADLILQDPSNTVAGVLHPTHEIQHLEEHPRVEIYREDILNAERMTKLIASISPQVIYHLAGMAHVHESWKNRKEAIETNFLGTFHLLEACRALPQFPKILIVGSGECYGVVPAEEQPIRESRPFAPTSPYAVSKIAQEMLAIQYAKAEGLPVYISRSFNHTGPRQKETFVCSAFARQIAVAELSGNDSEIQVGNLIARRDFLDVRDVVRAYQAILDRGVAGEPYNVCSEKAVSIEEILEILIGHSPAKFRVIADPEKFRPADMPLLVGSSEKLRAQTGWQPSYNIHSTLCDLLDYWRSRVKMQTPVS